MNTRTALLIATAIASLSATLPATAAPHYAEGSFVIARGGGDDYRSSRDDDRNSARRGDDGKKKGYGYGYERRSRDNASEGNYDDRRRQNQDDERYDDRRNDRGNRR